MKWKKKLLDHDYGEYVTTQEFSKLTEDHFASRLKQANLASKRDIADLLKDMFC